MAEYVIMIYFVEVIILTITIILALRILDRLNKTFENNSIFGKLTSGITRYVYITLFLEIFIISSILYDNIFLKININPDIVSEMRTILFIAIIVISYYILNKDISKFKKNEKELFEFKVSEQDLLEFGFVKRRSRIEELLDEREELKAIKNEAMKKFYKNILTEDELKDMIKDVKKRGIEIDAKINKLREKSEKK